MREYRPIRDLSLILFRISEYVTGYVMSRKGIRDPKKPEEVSLDARGFFGILSGRNPIHIFAMEKHKTPVASKEAEKSKPSEKIDGKESTAASVSETGTPVGKTVRTKKRKLNLKKYGKPAAIVVIVLALLGVAYHFKGIFVSAVVNGQPISRLSVIRELEKQAGQQALDRLITKKLVDAEVTRKKIVVAPADVDAEIARIEDQVTKQGSTLRSALEQQGMTEEDLREQLLLQKKLEVILGDKIDVSDDDVDRYAAQSGLAASAGAGDADFRDQIREQLKEQKFNDEVGIWIAAAKAEADISYYAGYAVPVEPALMEAADPEME